jgi:hypothetical protein
VKNQLLSISFSIAFFIGHHTSENNFTSAAKKAHKDFSIRNSAETVYNELHLAAVGLSEKAFQEAYKGYQYLLKKEKLFNTSILTICDLSQSSNKKRFYILDMAEDKVLLTTYVAHGKGSGMEYANRFSNRANSHQSSLGFYITGSTYYGEHGLSLRLQGLEHGFNDLAGRRNIVVHGASYIGDEYRQGNKCMGRSYGCPAVPLEECDTIIDLIKNGSCLFIYHPTKNYLRKSRIING